MALLFLIYIVSCVIVVTLFIMLLYDLFYLLFMPPQPVRKIKAGKRYMKRDGTISNTMALGSYSELFEYKETGRIRELYTDTIYNSNTGRPMGNGRKNSPDDLMSEYLPYDKRK